MPSVRTQERRGNAYQCLRVVLRVQKLRDSSQAKIWRLLGVLSIWHQQVTVDAVGWFPSTRTRRSTKRMVACRAHYYRELGSPTPPWALRYGYGLLLQPKRLACAHPAELRLSQSRNRRNTTVPSCEFLGRVEPHIAVVTISSPLVRASTTVSICWQGRGRISLPTFAVREG